MRRNFVAVAACSLFLLVACGGGNPATSAPSRTAAPGGTNAPVSANTAPVLSAATPATDGTTPAAGGTVDTCSLLTAAELSAATGKTYDAGKPDSVGQCLWNTGGKTANTGDLVILYVQPSDLSLIKSTFGAGGSDASVSGHAAFWNPSQGLGSMWVDLGGGKTLVLSFPRSEDLDASYLPIAQTIAE